MKFLYIHDFLYIQTLTILVHKMHLKKFPKD